ncbi:NADPH-dependent diflavin oxidoreductase ATR3 [Acorus calamus]|uniref:NADPH-dependent diflavin oxidoreductase 1 n=1 Tax=Acorus calamus TaxID=4465 RepID=A0AAV9F402_ACOCL|nr:NADPH-dependent diflavin oxidoreductase ATR3 [Acorus calamus]
MEEGEKGRPFRLLILYASQTGNAMDAAERVGREAERIGCPSSVVSMDEFDASCLVHERMVIFIVSTTGQGDPPDAMKVFWRYLLQKNLTRQWLEQVRYAVFGLGDSGYQKYNFAAKKLDKRLKDLGARPVIERGLGDDQHPSGYEGALDPWLSSLWNDLSQTNPEIFPTGSVKLDHDTRILGTPKFEIVYHDLHLFQESYSCTSDFRYSAKVIERACSMSPAKFRNDEYRPHYFLQMVKNDRLTRLGSDRDVRHFEFEALSSGLEYQVGDVLEVLPGQDPASVDAFIQRCNLNPDAYITVQPNRSEKQPNDPSTNAMGEPVRLRAFIALTMDVSSASPRRYFFEVMSFFAGAEHEKDKLLYFASPEGRDDLYQYNQKERRTVLEVLEDFPSVQMPFEWLVQLVPPLRTRAFSISSSPLAHPNQVHLTVSIVSWKTPLKRKRCGLCSTWLASLDPHDSKVHIPAWIHRGALPPPPPSLPLILVGPGTGCAPFRAYVEERAVQSVSENTAPILFFFGCRNEGIDFLYRDFWLSHAQNRGVLSEEKDGGFFVAFSRDQPQKIYVQHKMKQESGRIWSLLNAGASIYIAGSSTKMPADVTSCFEDIISQEGGVPKDSAARFLSMLERAGRFNVEAWS